MEVVLWHAVKRHEFSYSKTCIWHMMLKMELRDFYVLSLQFKLNAEAAALCIPTLNITSLQQSSTSLSFTSRVLWSPFRCRDSWNPVTKKEWVELHGARRNKWQDSLHVGKTMPLSDDVANSEVKSSCAALSRLWYLKSKQANKQLKFHVCIFRGR